MRITIDVDAETLARVKEVTGFRKQSPAVREALRAYLRELEKKQFLRNVLAGKTDYALTNEELEASGRYDAD